MASEIRVRDPCTILQKVLDIIVVGAPNPIEIVCEGQRPGGKPGSGPHGDAM